LKKAIAACVNPSTLAAAFLPQPKGEKIVTKSVTPAEMLDRALEGIKQGTNAGTTLVLIFGSTPSTKPQLT